MTPLNKKTDLEELKKKMDDLYKNLEAEKPPSTFNKSEANFNEGFYRGRLNAMEKICREVFGVNGDNLLSRLSTIEDKL